MLKFVAQCTQRSNIYNKYNLDKNASIIVINKYQHNGGSEAVKKRIPKKKPIDGEALSFIKEKIDEDVCITHKSIHIHYILYHIFI